MTSKVKVTKLSNFVLLFLLLCFAMRIDFGVCALLYKTLSHSHSLPTVTFLIGEFLCGAWRINTIHLRWMYGVKCSKYITLNYNRFAEKFRTHNIVFPAR